MMKLNSFHSPALAAITLLAAGLSHGQETAPANSSGVPIDFMRDVRPILESACIHCHSEEKPKGDFQMHTLEAALKGNENGPGLVAGNADESPIYWTTTLPADDDLVMPPKKQLSLYQQDILKEWIQAGAEWPDGFVLTEVPRMDFTNNILPILKKGGELSAKDIGYLRMWADQGAQWPADVKLGGDEPEVTGPADDLELIKQIREKITEMSTEKTEEEMKDYASVIPKTGAAYEMVAIPGGEFMLGSPDGEADRRDDEGPQKKVKIAPFWMGKYEMTWDQYEPFMITSVSRNKDGSPTQIAEDADLVDVVSSPTTPYVEMSFGMGTDGFPAICMTQHAANKFCEWLSAQTGHFYRLPTEAEWEYAARAGTTTAWSWGDDPEVAGEYAVYDPDPNGSRTGYDKIGTKKPNPWGLYDMHGNVMEWCLDQYTETAYSEMADENPWVKATTLYPRSARGGSWYDPVWELRSAARALSDPNWKVQDPQLPKSIWYHTDAHWLGFRIVRPLEVPTPEEMNDAWNLGIEKE